MKIANADALLRFFRFLHAYTHRLGFATTVLDDCARRRGRRVLKFHFIDRFRRSISPSSLISPRYSFLVILVYEAEGGRIAKIGYIGGMWPQVARTIFRLIWRN